MAEEWDLPEIGLRKLSIRELGAYWARYTALRPDIRYSYGNHFARWRAVPGAELNLSVYLTNHSTGVFLRGPRGEPYRTTEVRLAPYAAALSAALGVREKLGADFMFVSAHRCATTDSRTWPAAQEWLMREEDRYLETVVRIVVGAET